MTEPQRFVISLVFCLAGMFIADRWYGKRSFLALLGFGLIAGGLGLWWVGFAFPEAL